MKCFLVFLRPFVLNDFKKINAETAITAGKRFIIYNYTKEIDSLTDTWNSWASV